MGKTQLPPGLRFHPTDEELIKYYLKRKVLRKKLLFEGIVEVDIYKYAPWDLPDKSGWRSGDLKWYFFCPRAKKYASGSRMNRSTDLGYWKTTGKDRSVSYKNEVVGMIKTLVFHRGKAPKGDRTDWVMYEYRLEEKGLAERGVSQDAYVLCAIFKKDGPGPRNGAQYGAPFCEEDWDDDNKDNGEEGNGVQALPSIEMSVPLIGISNAQNILMPSSSIGSEINVEGSLVSCPSATLPSTGLPSAGLPSAGLPSAGLPSAGLPSAPEFPTVGSSDCIFPLEILQDDIDSIMNMFSEEGVVLPNENDKSAVVDNANIDGPDPCAVGMSIYDDLGDLGSLEGFGEPGHSMSTCCNSIYPKDPMFQGDDAQFMELIDLDVPLDISTEPQGYSYVQSGSLYASNNFGDSSAHPCYSTSSGVVVECSLSSQRPEGSCSLNYQPHVSSEETATGAIPNQGYDIYQAGSSASNASFFDGAHKQVTESEQSERRGRRHCYLVMRHKH